MSSRQTFQKKLITSVFLIVTITILIITAGVTFFEKNRFQKAELNRIYYETAAIKKRLGHLMFGSNWRYIMITLENARAANPMLLYFTLTDMNGAVLVSDDEDWVGRTGFDTVTIFESSSPVFEKTEIEILDKTPSRFKIYESRLNKNILKSGTLAARKNETVFDAFWDITYLGEKQGTLRIGFSRAGLKRHLGFLITGMLCTGFFVLLVTLAMIYRVVKKNLRPLDDFVLTLSDLHQTRGGGVLREKLASIRWDPSESEIREIQRIKQAFSKIRDLFILNWDQLESHRRNLEDMVTDRTRELNALNQKLSRQIQERKTIESRLINSQKLEAIGRLAGGIAHEFNNIFMAITGYASLIQQQSGPGHLNSEKAEKIRDLVDKGSHSVSQLLGFAKVGKYESGYLNINEIIRTNLEMFERTRRDIAVVTQYEDHIWKIYGDRSQMDQVVMNLLINASEAMPGNGQMTVATRNIILEKQTVGVNKIVSGRFVSLSVRDQGKGIKKENMSRVFDPFFTTKPFNGGSGLGLSSVYGVVDNHGGFTTIESAEGKGSLFSIFLPASGEQKESP